MDVVDGVHDIALDNTSDSSYTYVHITRTVEKLGKDCKSYAMLC